MNLTSKDYFGHVPEGNLTRIIWQSKVLVDECFAIALMADQLNERVKFLLISAKLLFKTIFIKQLSRQLTHDLRSTTLTGTLDDSVPVEHL